MTDPVRLLARPLLASMFLAGGVQALRNPAQLAPVVEDVTDAIGEQVDVVAQAETSQLVQANAAAQVVGGSLLALGKMPRLAATLLAGTLIPTTLAAHRFWEESDPQRRQEQQVHFFKNLSMLGGLGIAAMDLEGRASLPRRAKRGVERAALETKLATADARHAAELKAAELRHDVEQSAKDVTHAAKLKRKDAAAAASRARATAEARGEAKRWEAEARGRRLVPDAFDIAGAAIGWLAGSDDDDEADEAA